jgi:hypothetical protein
MTLHCPKCTTSYTGSCCGDPGQPCPRCGHDDDEILYQSPPLCVYDHTEVDAGC